MITCRSSLPSVDLRALSSPVTSTLIVWICRQPGDAASRRVDPVRQFPTASRERSEDVSGHGDALWILRVLPLARLRTNDIVDSFPLGLLCMFNVA
jgi:hypothetical protein